VVAPNLSHEARLGGVLYPLLHFPALPPVDHPLHLVRGYQATLNALVLVPGNVEQAVAMAEAAAEARHDRARHLQARPHPCLDRPHSSVEPAPLTQGLCSSAGKTGRYLVGPSGGRC
jgi:hypothetical protein